MLLAYRQASALMLIRSDKKPDVCLSFSLNLRRSMEPTALGERGGKMWPLALGFADGPGRLNYSGFLWTCLVNDLTH